MTLLDKLARKFGRYAVPNVTPVLVIGQAICFIALIASPNTTALYAQIAYIPALVPTEPWRVLTFLFVPETLSPLWIFFELYLLWLFGTALEANWGAFRYNVYLLVGYVGALLAALVDPQQPADNIYWLASVFFAFAVLHPDFQLLLFFILPVKVKWLAIITAAIFIIRALAATDGGNYQPIAVLAASTLNFALFFGRDIWARIRGTYRRMHRQAQEASTRDEAMHTCSVCGSTEQTDPQQEFRYFPTNEGVKCFCVEHYPDQAQRDAV